MTAPRRERLRHQRLYLIAGIAGGPTSPSDWLAAVASAVAAGVGLVQIRIKEGDTAVRRAALAEARRRLGPDVLLIVNDDLAAVCAADGTLLADGLHLGRQDAARLAPPPEVEAPARGPAGADAEVAAPVRGRPGADAGVTGPGRGRAAASATSAGLGWARRQLGSELLLGTSVRTLEELDVAVRAGADHVGFGAIAPSSTKDDTLPANLGELRRCVAAHPGLPIFAIGGLHPDNLEGVLAAGCRRAAVGSAVTAARDVGAVVAQLLARLD